MSRREYTPVGFPLVTSPGDNVMSQMSHAAHETVPNPPPGVTVKDPVCGMSVDPATSKHRHEHDGATYHFCAAGCRTKFTSLFAIPRG